VEVASRTQYAIRALVCLAVKRGEGVVNGAQIAEFGDIPRKYVEQVMHDLRQGGFVRSQRGKGGGYSLARDPSEISLLEVLETMEGSLDRLGRMPGGDPVAAPLEPVWSEVRTALRDCLGAATIAGVADRIAVQMYHI
jgi:Rrf2 family protein